MNVPGWWRISRICRLTAPMMCSDALFLIVGGRCMSHSSRAPRNLGEPLCLTRDRTDGVIMSDQGQVRHVRGRATTGFARRKRNAVAQRVLGDASTLLA